jgi:SAM-dependent methyltransferase
MKISTARPASFEKSSGVIWTDPHIQKSLLAAHLDPATDAASRRPEAIERTVAWLNAKIAPGSRILDLGCGPGLYAERLARLGHRVTGVDYNRRSIEYARNHAAAELSLVYVEGDYLRDFPSGRFDLVTLIYCDLGTFAPAERDALLARCRDALEAGGKLVFDVFNDGLIEDKAEGRTWECHPSAGFWSPEEHLLLQETFHYPEEKAYCYQYHLLTREKTTLFRIWEKYYTRDEITAVLGRLGFGSVAIEDNFLGKSDFTSAHYMFVTAIR